MLFGEPNSFAGPVKNPQNQVEKRNVKKRFNSTTQTPFVGALALICAYSLLLAVVPPNLTATPQIPTAEEASTETGPLAKQAVSTAAVPSKEDALTSVQ